MTAVITAGAASDGVVSWHAIEWQKAYHNVCRLQARIVKACQAGLPVDKLRPVTGV